MEQDLVVSTCTRCPEIVDSRSQIVNGVGPADPDVLFVGEAPGQTEDQEGEPFVGRSGSVLNDALRDAGLSRGDVRITNCLRCRPPDNRDPREEELAACREYLEREIATTDPGVLVTLGKVPGEHLLGRSLAVTEEAGAVDSLTAEGTTYPVVIALHPAATLYDGSTREAFFAAVERAVDLAGAGDQVTLKDF